MSNPVSTSDSYGQNLNQLNNLIRDFEHSKQVQIFKDDTGQRRVLLGRGSDGFYGVKVSQEGYDVTTASEDELVMTSDNNLFKIVDKISGSVTGADNSAGASWNVKLAATIPHGLSYIPTIFPYLTGSGYLPGQYRHMPAPNSFVAVLAFPWAAYIDASVDETNVYVRYYTCPNGNSSAESASYTIYLARETAT